MYNTRSFLEWNKRSTDNAKNMQNETTYNKLGKNNPIITKTRVVQSYWDLVQVR